MDLSVRGWCKWTAVLSRLEAVCSWTRRRQWMASLRQRSVRQRSLDVIRHRRPTVARRDSALSPPPPPSTPCPLTGRRRRLSPSLERYRGLPPPTCTPSSEAAAALRPHPCSSHTRVVVKQILHNESVWTQRILCTLFSEKSWYSFYRPAEGRRLSRPRWLATNPDDLTARK